LADAVSTHTMYDDGARQVAKFTNISDGTGEADVVKFDVSAMTPAVTEVDIEKIWYSTQGMSVRIEFDADTDTVAFLVPADADGFFDFTEMPPGSLRNNSSTGKTGDILFTTVGHTSGDTYVIIIQVKKRYTGQT
jgi:hypothetical protein